MHAAVKMVALTLALGSGGPAGPPPEYPALNYHGISTGSGPDSEAVTLRTHFSKDEIEDPRWQSIIWSKDSVARFCTNQTLSYQKIVWHPQSGESGQSCAGILNVYHCGKKPSEHSAKLAYAIKQLELQPPLQPYETSCGDKSMPRPVQARSLEDIKAKEASDRVKLGAISDGSTTCPGEDILPATPLPVDETDYFVSQTIYHPALIDSAPIYLLEQLLRSVPDLPREAIQFEAQKRGRYHPLFVRRGYSPAVRPITVIQSFSPGNGENTTCATLSVRRGDWYWQRSIRSNGLPKNKDIIGPMISDARSLAAGFSNNLEPPVQR